MLENYNRYRILKEFFKEPTEKLQLRELSRRTEISPPSVKNHLNKLIDQKLVKKIEKGLYPGYKANRNQKFKTYKKTDLVRTLQESGFIESLNEELSNPNAIVLFGSGAYGEDTEKSDIDILAISTKNELNLKKYEEKINRKINLQFMKEKEIKRNKEFANNLANGIVLDGYLVIK